MLGLKGGLGVGAGWLADRESVGLGGDSNYSWGDGALDFGLGAVSIPGLGVAKNLGRPMLGTAARVVPTRVAASPLGGLSSWMTRKTLGSAPARKLLQAGGMYSITKSAGGNDYGQSEKLGPFDVQGWLGMKPVQGPVLPAPVATGGTLVESMPTVSAVPITYAPSAAPVFNKTLKDYLADRQLQGLVNQNIFATNKPLLSANKSERVKEKRAAKQNAMIAKGLQAEADTAIASQVADNTALRAREAARNAALKAEVAVAESQVPVTYTDGEVAKAKADASVSLSNEQSLADSLVDRLATAGEAYVKGLKSAQQEQSRVDEKAIHNAASDAVRANVAQIRANQAQRGTLLGTLAQEQYRNALDLHNSSVAQYNASEDRRYQQAAADAASRYDAGVTNATLRNQVMLEGMKSAGMTPQQEAAFATYASLNDKISKMKFKTVPGENKKGEKTERLWLDTKAGKKAMAEARQERDRLKAKYGF